MTSVVATTTHRSDKQRGQGGSETLEGYLAGGLAFWRGSNQTQQPHRRITPVSFSHCSLIFCQSLFSLTGPDERRRSLLQPLVSHIPGYKAVWTVHPFLRAAVMKDDKLGILSLQYRGLEVWNPVFVRTMLFLKPGVPAPFLSPSWFWEFAGILWSFLHCGGFSPCLCHHTRFSPQRSMPLSPLIL